MRGFEFAAHLIPLEGFVAVCIEALGIKFVILYTSVQTILRTIVLSLHKGREWDKALGIIYLLIQCSSESFIIKLYIFLNSAHWFHLYAVFSVSSLTLLCLLLHSSYTLQYIIMIICFIHCFLSCNECVYCLYYPVHLMLSYIIIF